MANRVRIKVPVNGKQVREIVKARYGSFNRLEGRSSFSFRYIHRCAKKNKMPLEMCYEVSVIIGLKPETFCDFDKYFDEIKELYGWNERFED